MDDITKFLNPSTKKWIQSANPADIAKVIELGFLRASIDIPLSSVYKGKNGEEYIAEILKDRNFANTAKDGKSGDLILNTSHGKIMIEVKDYNRNVNKDEVKKFHRDLTAHSEVNGGVFISLNSGIVGIKEKFIYKKEPIMGREIPIIYMSTSDPSVINIGVDILISHLEAKIQVLHDQTELVQKINALSEHLGGLSNSRMQIDEFREDCNKSLDKLYKTILVSEISLRDHIDSIKNIITVETHDKNIKDKKKVLKYIRKTYSPDELVIDAAVSITNGNADVWTFGKESAHCGDFAFRFMKTKVEFSMVLSKKRLKKLTNLHIKASVKEGILYIPIDVDTHKFILGLIG